MRAYIVKDRKAEQANKNLIKTAERVADVDTDTLEENQFYATEEVDMADSVISDEIKEGNYNAVSSDAISQYMADQFYLDKPVTVGTGSLYAFTAEYDGIGFFKQSKRSTINTGTLVRHLDGSTSTYATTHSGSGYSTVDLNWTLPLVKGETYSYLTSSNIDKPYVRYYTKRDYSRR